MKLQHDEIDLSHDAMAALFRGVCEIAFNHAPNELKMELEKFGIKCRFVEETPKEL